MTEYKDKDKDFNYVLDKLNGATDKCDNSAIEWAVASTRVNEKALCKGEVSEREYMDRQTTVTRLVAGFMYNCKCSNVKNVQML